MTCELYNTNDKIRDQLEEHVPNLHIRERLLWKTNLTLAEAITIATQAESASKQTKSMAGEQHLPVHVV